jgi:hypothetical protein
VKPWYKLPEYVIANPKFFVIIVTTLNNILTKNGVSLLADLVKGIKELSGDHAMPLEHQV